MHKMNIIYLFSYPYILSKSFGFDPYKKKGVVYTTYPNLEVFDDINFVYIMDKTFLKFLYGLTFTYKCTILRKLYLTTKLFLIYEIYNKLHQLHHSNNSANFDTLFLKCSL